MKSGSDTYHPWRSMLAASLLGGVLWMPGTMVGPIPGRPAIAQELPPRTLTVTGKGSESIQTTLAVVELGVEIQGETAAAVQADVAQRSTAVVDLLQAESVEQLETVGLRLNPQYDYSNGQQRLIGYIGTNRVRFRLPSDRVGALLDEAVAAGATNIENLRFIADDAAIAAARQTALRAATVDAQQQANAVLSTLNLGAEEIIGIRIERSDQSFPVPLPERAQLASVEVTTTPVMG